MIRLDPSNKSGNGVAWAVYGAPELGPKSMFKEWTDFVVPILCGEIACSV